MAMKKTPIIFVLFFVFFSFPLFSHEEHLVILDCKSKQLLDLLNKKDVSDNIVTRTFTITLNEDKTFYAKLDVWNLGTTTCYGYEGEYSGKYLHGRCNVNNDIVEEISTLTINRVKGEYEMDLYQHIKSGDHKFQFHEKGNCEKVDKVF
jgi:hypothetical protein|tara:strand:- start:226 stop:672 length:447 start_codon:yes stop_codon:yes gene_type:complete